jgi:hypothetical protein
LAHDMAGFKSASIKAPKGHVSFLQTQFAHSTHPREMERSG